MAFASGRAKIGIRATWMADIIREISEALLAQLHSGYVAQTHGLRGLAGCRLDDYIFKLGGVGKAAERVDRKLEGLLLGYGRARQADLMRLDRFVPEWPPARQQS